MKKLLAALCSAVMLVTACSSKDPLAEQEKPAASSGSSQLVVGSQQYYSNEIIAEIYAQALEHAGYQVTRQFQIGQREIYMPEIQAGKIDVFPEYAGNLLQYLAKDSKAKSVEDITKELADALPKHMRALKPAEATDQDSYVVTKATAEKYGLTSIADLSKLGRPVTVAANSELEARPYGPKGLQAAYQVTANVTPVEDSGGPLTLSALRDGKVDVADLYTSDPALNTSELVVLKDPKNLILPQPVVPLVSQKVDEKAAKVIEGVQAKLSMRELQELNQRSVKEKARASTIAKEWLAKQGLV